MDEKLLRSFAHLIARRGVNVQPGQQVMVQYEPPARELFLAVAEACYQAGAERVHGDLKDDRLARLHLSSSSSPVIKPSFSRLAMMKEMMSAGAARLAIYAPENPNELEGISPAVVTEWEAVRREEMADLYRLGIGANLINWCVVSLPTPGWAVSLFPDLTAHDAFTRLATAMSSASLLDQPDVVAAWEAVDATLHRRGSLLTSHHFAAVCFRGPGTDLRVTLTPKSIWNGGSHTSVRGVQYLPNIPTYEVFTTPDWRGVEGHMRATRPVRISGVTVEGIELTFKGGEVVASRARRGGDALERYLALDPGARRLGEVALVGVDSPVFATGVVFNNILFDENAACHVAIGDAYSDPIEGGPSMSSDELRALGVNRCERKSVHTDIMISDTAVSVWGETAGGEEILLLERGAWVAHYR